MYFVKKQPKILGFLSYVIKKLLKENNRTIGKNSPNLVTLAPTDQSAGISGCC
jgi:hypothetical protein